MSAPKGPDGLYPTERRISSVGEIHVGGRVRITHRHAERLKDHGIAPRYVDRMRAGGEVADIVTSDRHGWTSVMIRLPASGEYSAGESGFDPSWLEIAS